VRRLVLACLISLLGLLAFGVSSAHAANLYLKDGCTFNGTGTAPGCAASGGASGAWNSVDNAYTGWSAVCAAGDTLFIRARDDAAETIASNNNDDRRWHGGLRAPCSGSSGNPVTITNYAGEVAKLANGPVGCDHTTCDNATLTTAERSYVRIGSTDGLYGTSGRLVVRGAIMAHGTGAQAGVVIVGVEVTQGWETEDDGNWAGIRLEDIAAPWVHHNYIHDIIMTSGTTNGSSCTGIKIYRSPGSLVEFNRVLRAGNTTNCGPSGAFESQAGGIDDKDGSVNNIHRYNYMSQVPVCLRFQNQGVTATGSQAYGIVCDRGTVSDGGGHGAIVTEAASIDDILIHHITINGWGLAFFLKGAINGSGGLTVRDNIVAAVSGGNPANRNYFDDGGAFVLADFNVATNFNAFDANADYQVDGTSTTIALWRTASSRDANSHEEAGGCSFVAGSDTNFHISGGPCATGSSTGGEQGAYGSATCVGHLCGSGAAPAPTVTSVSPSSGTTAGGTSVSVIGTGFDVGTAVITIGGVTCDRGGGGGGSSTSLPCTTGAHAAALVDVVVTNGDAQSGSLPNGYTYTTPPGTRLRALRRVAP